MVLKYQLHFCCVTSFVPFVAEVSVTPLLESLQFISIIVLAFIHKINTDILLLVLVLFMQIEKWQKGTH